MVGVVIDTVRDINICQGRVSTRVGTVHRGRHDRQSPGSNKGGRMHYHFPVVSIKR